MAAARSSERGLHSVLVGAEDQEATGSGQGEGAVAGDGPVRQELLSAQIGAVEAEQAEVATPGGSPGDAAKKVMLGGDQARAVPHQQVRHHRQTTIAADLLLGSLGELIGGETLKLLLTGIGGDQTQTQDGGNGQSE